MLFSSPPALKVIWILVYPILFRVLLKNAFHLQVLLVFAVFIFQAALWRFIMVLQVCETLFYTLIVGRKWFVNLKQTRIIQKQFAFEMLRIWLATAIANVPCGYNRRNNFGELADFWTEHTRKTSSDSFQSENSGFPLPKCKIRNTNGGIEVSDL